MKNNFVKTKEIEPLFKNKEMEMLYILKDIEFVLLSEKEKHKYYLEHNKEEIQVALLKILKEKRIERVIANKNLIYEKKLLENNRVIKRANKKVILPTIKVNIII